MSLTRFQTTQETTTNKKKMGPVCITRLLFALVVVVLIVVTEMFLPVLEDASPIQPHSSDARAKNAGPKKTSFIACIKNFPEARLVGAMTKGSIDTFEFYSNNVFHAFFVEGISSTLRLLPDGGYSAEFLEVRMPTTHRTMLDVFPPTFCTGTFVCRGGFSSFIALLLLLWSGLRIYE